MKDYKENLEVSFADYGKDEMEIKGEFISSCAMDDKLYVNTAGLSNKDTASMCAMQYMKMRPEILETGKGGLTDKQKKLPPALQKAILKRMEKKGELGEEGQKEAEELEATQIAVFPDKEIPVDEVGTPYQDMRPINKDGYKIDEELKNKAKKEKLKNPGLQSVSPPQS
jgi:hypothetical protein